MEAMHKTGESLTVFGGVHTLVRDSHFLFTLIHKRAFKKLSNFTAHRRSKTASALLLCATSLTLGACGFTWPDWAVNNSDPLGFLTSEDRAAKPPPAPQNSPLSLQSEYDPLVNSEPLSLRPGGPLGSLGLNLDMYFDPGIQDSETRIDRLERAVIALHRDLKAVAPELQGLGTGSGAPRTIAPPPPRANITPTSTYPPPVAAITTAPTPSNSAPTPGSAAALENKLQNTKAGAAPTSLFTNQTPAQLATTPQVITQTQPSYQGLSPMPGVSIPSAPRQPISTITTNSTPVTQTATATQAGNIPPPAPASIGTPASVNKGPRSVTNGGGALISGIRVGQHPDKVRIVFDVTKKTNYTADLDNGENILVVEMPDAKWKTPTKSESFGSQPIVKSYKVEDSNGGSGNLFILQLKQDTQILMKGKFPALSGSGERIVIDLKK